MRFMILFLMLALLLIGPADTHAANDNEGEAIAGSNHKPLTNVNCDAYFQRLNSLGKPSADSILLARGNVSATLTPAPTESVLLASSRSHIPLSSQSTDNSSTAAQTLAVGQLSAPFESVWIEGPAVQGESVMVWLRVADGTTVRGELGKQQMTFRNHCGFLWGLVAFDALDDNPGSYSLNLHATYNGRKSTTAVPIQLRAGDFWTGPAIAFPPEKQDLLAPQVINSEKAYVSNILLNLPEDGPFWRGPFQLPRNASTTAGFGARGTENGSIIGYHEGIDYRGFIGTPFHAPARGQVIIAETLRVRGNTTYINHGAGVVTAYFHMDKMNFKVGDWVELDDVIGTIGNTGLSTGPHLHWEVHVNGRVVNPKSWLRRHIPVPAVEVGAADWAIPYGRFYTQTADGKGGFTVVDDRNARFLSHFLRLGGVQAIGYPISQRYRQDGFLTQAFQKQVLQWRPEVGEAWPTNVFDDLSIRGFDYQLFNTRQIPRRLGPNFDRPNAPWEEVMNTRWALLDGNQGIRNRYFSVADPITAFGLPTSYVEDMGNHYALRAQRALFQQWKVNVPWAAAGEVTIANGGDIMKELGLIPTWAIRPEPMRER